MSDDDNLNMWSGTHGRYFWVVAAVGSPLAGQVPIRLEGRRVVLTSFDSGELRLNEDELRTGWTQVGRTAMSPPIVDLVTFVTQSDSERDDVLNYWRARW